MTKHFHLHDEAGQCNGDFAHFKEAARGAAEHAYPYAVTDYGTMPGEVLPDDILTVIEAPFCIDVCRADERP